MSISKIEQRLVIVTRPTRLDNILAKENTISQARFKISSLNKIAKRNTSEANTDFELYEEEHNQYQNSIRAVREQINHIASVQMLDRKYLSNFVFAESDIIICLGQDGLVANTIKYLNGQPVIGINPDKKSYDGVLLPFEPKDAIKIVQEVIQGKRKTRDVRMGEVGFPDGQKLLAVNDFFIGQRGHASARYVIKYNGLKEPQISSGVIISTGLGSTGWMKSIIGGAREISSSVIGRPYGFAQENESLVEEDILPMYAGGKIVADITPKTDKELIMAAHTIAEPAYASKEMRPGLGAGPAISPRKAAIKAKKEYGHSELSSFVGKWDSTELVFAVREPFPSKASGTGIVFGIIHSGNNLRIESLMGENGVIFSDGIENDFLEFNSGMEATISLSERKGHIVI